MRAKTYQRSAIHYNVLSPRQCSEKHNLTYVSLEQKAQGEACEETHLHEKRLRLQRRNAIAENRRAFPTRARK